MAQQLSAVCSAIWIFWRELDEARGRVSVNFGIKVCPFDIHKAELHPAVRLWVPVGRLITMRTASNGGAGAKYEVPEESSAFICLAT